MSSELPPFYRALYDAAGPVIRFRLLRDVLGQDESYVETLHRALDLNKLPELGQVSVAQDLDGSWNGLLCGYADRARITTENAILRLCELGLESSEPVRTALEKSLVPTLTQPEIIWEFQRDGMDDRTSRVARHIVRDKVLRLIARATREYDELIRPGLEGMLIEWDFFFAHPDDPAARPPTADGYAALCWYPWSEDEFPRAREMAEKLMRHAERSIGEPMGWHELYADYVFQLCDKWEYLARPPLLFHELELAARLGVAGELPVTRWLLEELEARQDADGMFRFPESQPLEPTWYYPLEDHKDNAIEWTFRAALIYRLLEYDL